MSQAQTETKACCTITLLPSLSMLACMMMTYRKIKAALTTLDLICAGLGPAGRELSCAEVSPCCCFLSREGVCSWHPLACLIPLSPFLILLPTLFPPLVAASPFPVILSPSHRSSFAMAPKLPQSHFELQREQTLKYRWHSDPERPSALVGGAGAG